MAAPKSKHYIDEVGTVVLINTGGDISDADTVSLDIKKPSGAIVEWVGTVADIIRDGITYENYGIRYVILAGDFNEAGIYKLQSLIDGIPGNWPGNTANFRIYARFDEDC